MSAVQVAKESLPHFMAGNGTVGASAAKLTTAPFEVLKHVVICADAGNSGTISVGDAESTAVNGFVLAAGEKTPSIYIDDTSKIWLVGSGAGQDYNWIAN